MTDSTEVYGCRPSPVLAGVIYCLCGILVIAVLWMSLFQIDVVVRSSGMVKCNDITATIFCSTSGKIIEYRMEDDSFVKA